MTKPKRKYRRLSACAFLTGAVLAYRYLRKPANDSAQAPTPKHPPNPPNIEWISADKDDTNEPLPMFYVGDKVLIYNPYTGEFYCDEYETIAPTRYEITDYLYDEDEQVFRYQLKNGDMNDWYSEDWLSLPVHSEFIRELEPFDIGKMEVPTQELIDAGNRVISKWLDDQAREGNIDRLLDVMRNDGSTAEEKAEAKRTLAKIVSGEESE